LSFFTKRNERKARFKDFPYSLIYLMEKEEMVVMAIAHSRRMPNYWR